jgi:heme/copper-type cytochrome/quinol oxidase subunit 1
LLLGLGLVLLVDNSAAGWGVARGLCAGARPGDPYEAGTLEWATESPPPEDNFGVIPEVRSGQPLADWRAAQAGQAAS